MTTGVQGRPTRDYVDYQVIYFVEQVGFASDGLQIEIGWMPAGAIVTGVSAEVTTAFDDTTTDLITVGITADPSRFASLDVAALGTVFDATTLDAAVKTFSADQLLVCQFDGGTGDAAAGECRVIVTYVVDSSLVT